MSAKWLKDIMFWNCGQKTFVYSNHAAIAVVTFLLTSQVSRKWN